MTGISRWRDSGREVAVLGLGASGAAVTRLLASNKVRVYASDSSADSQAVADELGSEFPDVVEAVAGLHDLDRIKGADALVVSPGIPPEAPPIRAARQANVEVFAEAEVASWFLHGLPAIAVTGTNGKTTVTELINHILITDGRESVAAGNVGMPLSEVARQPALPEWLVMELSSFQLHDMPSVAPAIAVLTNLSSDHLDRYPTLEAYWHDKSLIFRNANLDSVTISNQDDDASREMVGKVPGTRLSFSTRDRADGWYNRDTGFLMLAQEQLVERAQFSPLGDHNVANALAAALAAQVAGVSIPVIQGALRSFVALPHRMEPVATSSSILYLNDSKATNVASTQVALAAMTLPYVLLLGGRHKGQPYSSLLPQLDRLAVAVVTFGEAAELVAHDIGGSIRVEHATDFKAAVGLAARLAPEGGAVLLSPACSSYDMFDNYRERGEAFRKLARSQ